MIDLDKETVPESDKVEQQPQTMRDPNTGELKTELTIPEQDNAQEPTAEEQPC